MQFELDALDVNAVGFIDETSNIIYSGSDNGIIKVGNAKLSSFRLLLAIQQKKKHSQIPQYVELLKAISKNVCVFYFE